MLKTLAHPLDPQRGVGIQHDIFGGVIVKQLEHRIAKFALQFRFKAAMLFIVSEPRNCS